LSAAPSGSSDASLRARVREKRSWELGEMSRETREKTDPTKKDHYE